MPTYAVINGSVVQPLFTRLWLSPSCCLPYCKPSSPSHFLFPRATAAILIVGATPCNGSCYCSNRVTNSGGATYRASDECWSAGAEWEVIYQQVSSALDGCFYQPARPKQEATEEKRTVTVTLFTGIVKETETPRCTVLCKSLKSFYFMWAWSAALQLSEGLLKVFFGHELLFHSFQSLLIAFCGFAFYTFVNWCLK